MDQGTHGQMVDPEVHIYATTDHEFIRQWVAERNGVPALVRRIGQENQGDIVVNFPDDGSDEPIVDISWADFFQRFEDQDLAFVYQESGPETRFYRLVDRQTAGMKGE